MYVYRQYDVFFNIHFPQQQKTAFHLFCRSSSMKSHGQISEFLAYIYIVLLPKIGQEKFVNHSIILIVILLVMQHLFLNRIIFVWNESITGLTGLFLQIYAFFIGYRFVTFLIDKLWRKK